MISVCLATYNGDEYIKQQVDSILVQLGVDDEIIVSDDGSTDATIEILKSYNDSRIKIYTNDNFKGVVGNFENAIKHSQGDQLFLCDQDDVWLENKVTVCLSALLSADLVVTDCYITDSELNIVSESFFKEYNSGAGFFKNMMKNTYLGACVAFNRNVLDYCLPFPKNLPVYHEGWLALLTEVYGKVTFVDYKAIYYRRHEKNVSATASKSRNNMLKKISIRLLLLFLIIKRTFVQRKIK